MKVYIDFDSCYYNLARRLFGITPWTVITNKFNHVISAPHWLEGHFGVKKIAYLAPPVKVKPKVKRPIRVFNIDAIPSGRDIMIESLTNVLERVKVIAPDASIVHKDSIVAEVEGFNLSRVRDAVNMPCTVGIGCSEEEAKSDCKAKKVAKRRSHGNIITLILYFVPMVVSHTVYILRRKQDEDYKNHNYACPNRI